MKKNIDFRFFLYSRMHHDNNGVSMFAGCCLDTRVH